MHEMPFSTARSGRLGSLTMFNGALSNRWPLSSINKYGVDWNTLRNSNKLMLTPPVAVNLSLTLQAVQGGVISPSGELFYVVCGFYDKTGYKLEGKQKLECAMTIKGGKVVYDLNGIANPIYVK